MSTISTVEGGREVLNVFGSAKTTIVMVFVIRSRRVERLDNFRQLFRVIPPGWPDLPDFWPSSRWCGERVTLNPTWPNHKARRDLPRSGAWGRTAGSTVGTSGRPSSGTGRRRTAAVAGRWLSWAGTCQLRRHSAPKARAADRTGRWSCRVVAAGP